MDSEPDLADEPDDDKLDIPNADEDPEKLAEPGAFRMLPQLAPNFFEHQFFMQFARHFYQYQFFTQFAKHFFQHQFFRHLFNISYTLF